MSAIYDLLTFPTVSNAFSAYPGITTSNNSSHPRKTRRLADDSDSASAFRSRDATGETGEQPSGEQKTGPIVFEIVGASYKPPSLDRFGEQSYNTVVKFIRAFLVKGNKEKLPATYESVYNACRTAVVIAGKGDGLYDHLKLALEKCVGELRDELLRERLQGVKWIAPFVALCVWFENRVKLLQSLLSYLDGVFVKNSLLNIRSLAFQIFSSNIFSSPDVIRQIKSAIQEWVHWERENRIGHELRPSVSDLVTQLVTHHQYEHVFESHYVEMTEFYYSEESNRVSKAMKSDPAGFLMHCFARIREETQRSNDILLDLSWEVIRSATESALLRNRLGWVAMEGLPHLMETENVDALKDMYSSFVRIGHATEVVLSFKSYVLTTVESIVADKNCEEQMVHRLLEFKAFAEKIVNTAFVDQVSVSAVQQQRPYTPASPSTSQTELKFVSNQECTYALVDAFQAGFKARRNKPAEMIAKFLDKAMRKGQKDASDADFNSLLDGALALYRFTEDKDVFRAYYHRALAKRLLSSRSASDAFETSILKRLKEKYDPEFDMGELMFKDIALSRDLVSQYREHRLKGKARLASLGKWEDEDLDEGPKLTTMVFQQGVWPFSARKHNIDLPPYMLSQIMDFTEFYKARHKGRVLSWDHSLGNASVIAQFKAGQKELLVSLYQAIVLLLFNDVDEISFKDIKVMTSMDDQDLRRTLQSLACTSKKILKKRPAGRDVGDDDVIYYNANFTHPRYQVRIDSIQAKETPEEAKQTEDGIKTDRKFLIDAAIVRIMKARKERTFEQLKIDVVDAVKAHFVPDMKHFKERVDSLVEGEFLRRDEDNRDLFYYVA